jgi:uncharacterized protein (TIGR02145 family)
MTTNLKYWTHFLAILLVVLSITVYSKSNPGFSNITEVLPPTVLTSQVKSVNQNSAIGGGEITSDGGMPIISKGICWSLTINPTTANNFSIAPGSSILFSSVMTGLLANTTYHFRAYATNADGTSYGNDVSFTTSNGPDTFPLFTTLSVSSITQNSANSGGVVTEDRGLPILVRGVCWSTSTNPLATDGHTSDGTGVGKYTSTLLGLSPGTLYYVRAYATHANGTFYGNEVTFSTIAVVNQLPTVTTQAMSAITTTTATSGGNVTSDGGSAVTARGICWSTNTNPTLANSFTTDGSGTGAFISNITGLLPSTSYYMRAYATNGVGTAYGNEVSFITTAIPNNCGSVTDIDGTIYNAVTIGTQCWTQTNLDVSKYRNGDPIPEVTDATEWSNLTTGAWCYFDNNSANGPVYGKLYNWHAVNDPRGLAPEGWHVPSDEEWNVLTTYLGGQSVAGGKMKEAGTTHWTGPNTGADNSSGFTGLPGELRSLDGSFWILGETGYWWSSTDWITGGAYNLMLSNWITDALLGYSNGKKIGFSVRCIKNSSNQLPTLTTTAVSSITNTTASSGGTITSDGGSPVTVRGICWSTSISPTLANSFTADGTGIGAFTSNLTILSPGTTYYVRAYATNAIGTAYGNEVTFTTSASTSLCGSVTDIDGTLYNSITIGTQCWTQTNLNVSKYRNGDLIPQVTDPLQWDGLTTGAWCYYNNDPATAQIYGKLYNWYAVNDPRGLAPVGFHIPTDAEWTTLTTYLGGLSVAGGKMKETGTVHWQSPNTGATNSSGFTSLPGGQRRPNGEFAYLETMGCYWTASEIDATHAWLRYLYHIYNLVYGGVDPNTLGLSVRCLKD